MRELYSRGPMMSRICQCALISVVLLLFSATAKAEESIADSIDAILDNADTLYSRKAYEHARREYERAIAIDRGSLRAWEMLAWSLWALGEKEHAYQMWADLLKAFPDNKQILADLGKASEQDHHWDRALDYYAQLLRYEPGNEAAHLGRARIFLAQRLYKAAEQEIRKVLKNAPLGANAESLLADVLIGQRRYGDAEALLRPLTKTEPVPMNLRRLGMVLAELGRHEEAAAYFRRSLHFGSLGRTSGPMTVGMIF